MLGEHYGKAHQPRGLHVCAEQLLKLAQGVCKGDSAAVTLVTDSSFIVAAGAGMLEGCAAWVVCVLHLSA